MKHRILPLFVLLTVLPTLLLACRREGLPSAGDPVGSGEGDRADSETPQESFGTPDTEAPDTEPPAAPELKASGWCAVGKLEGDRATILADTGAVTTLRCLGEVTPGLIHAYEYDRRTQTLRLTLAPTFPEVAERDSAGNDLSAWNMGAYPSSSSLYYGGSYALSDDTPVFVRYGNTEWRLAHGKAAFASDGLTRGYIHAEGSRLCFVMIVGACGSLETMRPADAEVTRCMDPDGIGFPRGNISLDGGEIPDERPQPELDDKGLTVPDGSGQTLIYKRIGDKLLRMSFLPPTQRVYDKAPVCFLITGGGWNSCDRQGMLGFSAISAEKLRAAGFAVTSLDYRILQDGADMIAMISDCLDGVRYLVHYAEEAGIDPERIVIAGHSAGGQLALMTALGEQSRFTKDSVFAGLTYRPLGCVAMSPLTVCYPTEGRLLTAVSHLPQLFESEEEAKACSPLDALTAQSCPILITTGTEDPVVYPENTYLFRDRAEALGAPVTVLLSERAGHSYEPMNGAGSVSVSFTGLQNLVADYILGLLREQ